MKIDPSLSNCDQLAEWLAKAALEYVQFVGGYRDEIGVVEGHVIIASFDGNDVTMEIITPEFVEAWVGAVKEHLESDDFEPGDDDEILWDLRPSDDAGFEGPA